MVLTAPANSVQLRMIQSLMLDLLSDVTDDIVGNEGLPEVSGCFMLPGRH